jgi:hypothetical protein
MVTNAQRALQVQQLQQLRDCRDLVGLLGHGLLPQAQVTPDGPGTDQVQRRLAVLAVVRPSKGFAVDGDVLEIQGPGDFGHPGGEASLELSWVECGEEASEGVVGGDAVGQAEKAFEPVVLGTAVLVDIDPGVGPASDGTDGEGNDIEQVVQAGTLQAGIGQSLEMGQQRTEPSCGHAAPEKEAMTLG